MKYANHFEPVGDGPDRYEDAGEEPEECSYGHDCCAIAEVVAQNRESNSRHELHGTLPCWDDVDLANTPTS